MFDNTNSYDLRIAIVGGLTRYFASFTDGEGERHETEVSCPVYLEFLRFVKTERNLRRSDERHIEQSELTDEALCNRAMNPPDSVEDTVFDSLRHEHLRVAIEKLPEIQRRRFVLYYEFGLTYEQIAEIEGCHFTSVGESISRAEKNIRKSMEAYENSP